MHNSNNKQYNNNNTNNNDNNKIKMKKLNKINETNWTKRWNKKATRETTSNGNNTTAEIFKSIAKNSN